MHELSIAQSILEIAERHLPPDRGQRVTAVRLKVGELAGVVEESLLFCFGAITAGTRLEGASLDIERVPLSARCGRCTLSFAVRNSTFLCPSCGSGDLVVTGGRELQVTEIELQDHHSEAP